MPWLVTVLQISRPQETKKGKTEKVLDNKDRRKRRKKSHGSESRANRGLVRCRGNGQATTGQVEAHAGQLDFADEATKGFDSSRSHECGAEAIDL